MKNWNMGKVMPVVFGEIKCCFGYEKGQPHVAFSDVWWIINNINNNIIIPCHVVILHNNPLSSKQQNLPSNSGKYSAKCENIIFSSNKSFLFKNNMMEEF